MIKALAVTVMAMMVIFVAIFLLCATERASFLDIAFEVLSAFGTVGLSRGLTPHLSVFGQYLIMLVMFAGRLGPLTAAYMLATPRKSQVRYAETEIQIG